MKLINKSRNLIIAENVKMCRSFFSRLKGLMFSLSLKNNEALVLEAEKESFSLSSIHTFFVFFPIDVVWLDRNFNVVDVKSNIRPFSLFIRPKRAAKYVIELKRDMAWNIGLNDKLVFI